MESRALLGPRRLTKEIPAYQGIHADGVFPAFAGWINGGLNDAIMYETYFDMSGLTLDDLTFVPGGVQLQDPGRYSCTNVDAADVEVLDIISQERLTIVDIDANLSLGNAPGMMITTEDFTQIIFGQYRLMLRQTTSSNTEILTTVDGGNFSSQEPTAAAKVWCYRFMRVNNAPLAGGNDLRIPASRFVVVGTTIEEKELSYMMRLKRSYELTQQA